MYCFYQVVGGEVVVGWMWIDVDFYVVIQYQLYVYLVEQFYGGGDVVQVWYVGNGYWFFGQQVGGEDWQYGVFGVGNVDFVLEWLFVVDEDFGYGGFLESLGGWQVVCDQVCVVVFVGVRVFSVSVWMVLFIRLLRVVQISWWWVSGSLLVNCLVIMIVLKCMLLVLFMLVFVLGKLFLIKVWMCFVFIGNLLLGRCCWYGVVWWVVFNVLLYEGKL